MKKTKYLLAMTVGALLSAVVLLAAAGTKTPRIFAEKIRSHVKYLSSDALEGRGTGQQGGDAAADYLAKQFESYGLKPAGDNGTFFQSVPMVGVKTRPETTFALVGSHGESVPLKFLDEFVTNNESQAVTAQIDAPIVFVGHGITAPEYNWDDYKGADLKGKVALLFVNEPASDDPKFFKGKALTYYGRWTYKYEETARRGAVATLIIHRTDLASYGWEVVRNSWGTERSYLKLDGAPKLQAASWVQLDVAKKLVAMVGLDLDKLYQQSQSRDFQPIDLHVNLKAHVASDLRPFVSRNVVAKLEGGNAKLREEAVLYTAHYDHLGINPAVQGDNIYNGAIDNATGCGILLELARAWSVAKPQPARSILFAAVTAEEQGLLGSEYFGKHPAIPGGKISLDLNFDALPPLTEPEEIEVSGAERTTFYPIVQEVAKRFAMAIRPDPHPEAGHYYRSDHFSLARVGVPSFSVNEGVKFKGHDAAWGEAQAKNYVDHDYHAPSDDFRASWNFKGLAKMTQFGFALGEAAASDSSIIDWRNGDEFEGARKSSYAEPVRKSRLLEGLPDLQVIQYEPVSYPPLARQARISGPVRLNVTVDEAGKVAAVESLSGHPLLKEAGKQNMTAWRFAPRASGPITFEMVYDFVLTLDADSSANQGVFFDVPQHVRIVAAPAIINTVATGVAARGD